MLSWLYRHIHHSYLPEHDMHAQGLSGRHDVVTWHGSSIEWMIQCHSQAHHATTHPEHATSITYHGMLVHMV